MNGANKGEINGANKGKAGKTSIKVDKQARARAVASINNSANSGGKIID